MPDQRDRLQKQPTCPAFTVTNSILGFFISAHGYARCKKTLGGGFGLGVSSEKPVLEVTDHGLPHIKDILAEMCDDANHQMKQLSSDKIGSWSRPVTWLLANEEALSSE